MNKRKCAIPNCKRQAAKHRTICNTCKNRKYRESNGLRVAYLNQKHNAARRGKEFTLTFEYYREFAQQAEFKHRGRTSQSFHIDRIDDSKGYIPGNLRLITNSENIRKDHKRRAEIKKHIRYDWQSQTAVTITTLETNNPEPTNDCPF